VRVFLDTNVLVSAFVSRGLCTDLLEIVLAEHELLVSDLVVEEFERVLRDKLGAPKPVLERALSIFDHVEVAPRPTEVAGEPGLDRDDAIILAEAIEAQADIFVTGDQELLAAAKGRSLPAVPPRRFMELLRVPRDSYPIPSDGDSGVSESVPSAVREVAFEFALTVIALCKKLEEGQQEVLARQLLRAGASIGANLEDGGVAESRREIDRRMASALRQGCETKYWLRLLSQSGIATGINFEPYLEKCRELIRLLATAHTEQG
jgi:putative PIN family toxin of toxin-antitoxin system